MTADDPGPLEPAADEVPDAAPQTLPEPEPDAPSRWRALCPFCDTLGPEDGSVPSDWFLDKWLRTVCPACAHSGRGEWA